MKPFLIFILAVLLALTFMAAIVVRHDRAQSNTVVNAQPQGEPRVTQPPGEPTTTTLPATPPVTAWFGGHPATNFITASEGKNMYGVYMWHGTIDGIECLIYGGAMMCKGFAAAGSAP